MIHQRNGVGAVVHLVDAHQIIGQLEHVDTQRDNDELRIASALLRGKRRKNL